MGCPWRRRCVSMPRNSAKTRTSGRSSAFCMISITRFTPRSTSTPQAGEPILREHGYPDDIIYAIMAHGTHLGLPLKSKMDKTLWAVDELTGFVTAAALVRPNKSIMELEANSVRKKMKDKAFARAVRREDISGGAETTGAAAGRAHCQRHCCHAEDCAGIGIGGGHSPKRVSCPGRKAARRCEHGRLHR